MARISFAGAIWFCGLPAGADNRLTLPSGLDVRFHEVISAQLGEGEVYRFRFISPEFSADRADVEELGLDMEHLCNAYAMPKLSNDGVKPGQVVISLADRITEFGRLDPEVSQVFEAFTVNDGVCVWEEF